MFRENSGCTLEANDTTLNCVSFDPTLYCLTRFLMKRVCFEKSVYVMLEEESTAKTMSATADWQSDIAWKLT